MDFAIYLPSLKNWKKDGYNLILVIVKKLIKKIYYKFVKITINANRLFKFINNIIIRYYSFSNSILSNENMLFKLKFPWSSYYFLGIKQKPSITFYLQIND